MQLACESPLLVACVQLQQEAPQGFGFLVIKGVEEISLDSCGGVGELVCDAASWGCKGNGSLTPVVRTRAALDQRVDGVEYGAHVARVGSGGGGQFGEWEAPALAKRQQDSVRRRGQAKISEHRCPGAGGSYAELGEEEADRGFKAGLAIVSVS
jgi:hypothetical protein